jgi:hypothetical protein
MRPSVWHPPVEPSSLEQTVITRIKRAKLFVFLRDHRHELFDDGLFGPRMIFTTLAMTNPDLVRVCPQQLYLFGQHRLVGPKPLQS